jgi:hypothetical protein
MDITNTNPPPIISSPHTVTTRVRELYPEEVEINNNIQRIDAIQRQIRTLQDEREDFPL